MHLAGCVPLKQKNKQKELESLGSFPSQEEEARMNLVEEIPEIFFTMFLIW